MQNNIELIYTYIESLSREKKISQNTIEVYQKEIGEFIDYIYPENILSANNLKVMRYIEKLKENYSERTIKRKLISINGLYKFLFKNEIILLNPLDGIKFEIAPKKTSTNFNNGEINTLLDYCEENPKGVRDKLLISLLLSSGLKINDLLDIKTKDIIGFEEINILKKNGRISISLEEKDKILLKRYILENRDKIEEEREEYLFKNLTRQNFRARFIKYSKMAGIKGDISPNEIKKITEQKKNSEKLDKIDTLEKIRAEYIKIGIGDD
ncbi:MAG: tyrosine-type recombinase/integrase [Fusobacteriaceae bacterium]